WKQPRNPLVPMSRLPLRVRTTTFTRGRLPHVVTVLIAYPARGASTSVTELLSCFWRVRVHGRIWRELESRFALLTTPPMSPYGVSSTAWLRKPSRISLPPSARPFHLSRTGWRGCTSRAFSWIGYGPPGVTTVWLPIPISSTLLRATYPPHTPGPESSSVVLGLHAPSSWSRLARRSNYGSTRSPPTTTWRTPRSSTSIRHSATSHCLA